MAVNSYEGKGALVFLLIGGDELALDEAGVCMKSVRLLFTGLEVHTYPSEESLNLSYEAVKIRDRGRIATFGVGA